MGGEKNFTLEELFEIKTSPWLNIWSVVVQKDNLWNELYEFVWRTQENYWIQGYVDLQKNVSPNDWWVISISQVGSVHAQIRKNSWYGSQNIFILRPIESERLLNHYVITSINKKLSKYNISYTTFPTLKTLKEELITLPTYSNWEIAYDYMENYIKEIEAYHIKEIEAYLQSTGLSDYELNKEEIESLRIIAEGKGKSFTLDELFEKKTMKWYPKSAKNLIENKDWYHIFWQNIKYQYPQKVLLDESYLHKINKDEPILAYTSSVWEIWMIYENFYRSWDNWAFQWLYQKFSSYNKKHILFILACLNKKFKQFNYWTWMSKIMDLELNLPCCNNWEIDFDLIETYITATQKLVIKDLVEHINEKLKTYKEII